MEVPSPQQGTGVWRHDRVVCILQTCRQTALPVYCRGQVWVHAYPRTFAPTLPWEEHSSDLFLAAFFINFNRNVASSDRPALIPCWGSYNRREAPHQSCLQIKMNLQSNLQSFLTKLPTRELPGDTAW